MKQNINVGIGFATGRKSFRTVLKTYIYNWKESGLTNKENISLNLFIAYDLKYSNTQVSDYTNIKEPLMDLVDNCYFIGTESINCEINKLISNNVLTKKEAKLIFSSGYAAKRNAILYFALKNHIDYIVFLDDDEYPLAVTQSETTALWSGQQILKTHLQHIENADITNGHHCGYISPLPKFIFNDTLTENDLRIFIEAISNDIISWDNMKFVMSNGGVTYADKKILTTGSAEEVREIQGTKFISGANLCINLTNSSKVYPFYNPPKARGEDTFLSTCLNKSTVLRVPCYTFHDAFSLYVPLMSGVLPITLQGININSHSIVTRFYKACVGWIRYKPLFLYITNPEQYDSLISIVRKQLSFVLPKMCNYFSMPRSLFEK